MSKRVKKFAVSGAVMFAAVLLICVVAVSYGSTNTPSAVAEAFYDAIAKGDMEAAGKHATSETIDSYGPFMPKLQQFIAMYGKGRAVSQEIDGDEAVVVLKFANHEEEEEVNLVKVDGKWKVEMTLSSGSGK